MLSLVLRVRRLSVTSDFTPHCLLPLPLAGCSQFRFSVYPLSIAQFQCCCLHIRVGACADSHSHSHHRRAETDHGDPTAPSPSVAAVAAMSGSATLPARLRRGGYQAVVAAVCTPQRGMMALLVRHTLAWL